MELTQPQILSLIIRSVEAGEELNRTVESWNHVNNKEKNEMFARIIEREYLPYAQIDCKESIIFEEL